ncbi:hypothetical protein IQ07DRAFT_584404 [Pyrenochaeta sp. DS3sAY3a]|nr:hypothetical protein IQ07DRAFT_584404 [Pyrenochaeta sp. DS3sAY3a]
MDKIGYSYSHSRLYMSVGGRIKKKYSAVALACTTTLLLLFFPGSNPLSPAQRSPSNQQPTTPPHHTHTHNPPPKNEALLPLPCNRTWKSSHTPPRPSSPHTIITSSLISLPFTRHLQSASLLSPIAQLSNHTNRSDLQH